MLNAYVDLLIALIHFLSQYMQKGSVSRNFYPAGLYIPPTYAVAPNPDEILVVKEYEEKVVLIRAPLVRRLCTK